LKTLLSTKTAGLELHKSNIHGITALAKPLITEHNAERQKRCCYDHKTWMSDYWKYIIWSNELSCMLFPTSGQVDVWRRPKEAYNPEFLVLVVKAGGGSLMIWTATYWYSAQPVRLLSLS